LPEYRKEIKIERTKLLLAEGRDAELFLVWARKKYRQKDDVQVIDFGGVTELYIFLKTLSQVENFDKVETLVIVRDSETDANAAKDSIQHALKENELPVPLKPFSYEARENFKTAFMLFPGPKFPTGTLEDLCLDIVKDDPIIPCVVSYLECLKSNLSDLTVPHKRKLHTFLAGKEKDLVGATIGQASYRNAWNHEHPALEPFKEIIIAM
jgi:hypothetical protein